MAHIQKVRTRSGRVRVQARYIDPTGKERAKNFDTQAEARNFVVGVESAKLKGEWMAPAPARRTFGEWAERVEASRINLRENPRLRDAWIVKELILPTFAGGEALLRDLPDRGVPQPGPAGLAHPGAALGRRAGRGSPHRRRGPGDGPACPAPAVRPPVRHRGRANRRRRPGRPRHRGGSLRRRPAAHLLLFQVGTRVLNDELSDVFRRWYPEFVPTPTESALAAA